MCGYVRACRRKGEEGGELEVVFENGRLPGFRTIRSAFQCEGACEYPLERHSIPRDALYDQRSFCGPFLAPSK